jgi:type II secretory pathway pseudopilin PulG
MRSLAPAPATQLRAVRPQVLEPAFTDARGLTVGVNNTQAMPLLSKKTRAAFTITELMVALAASVIILGALGVAALTLSRSFSATRSFSEAQAAQVRLIDAIALDLRRAIEVAITTSATSNPSSTGNVSNKFAFNPAAGAGNTKTIDDGTYDKLALRVGGSNRPSTYLTLTIPGFYRSNVETDAAFRDQSALIATKAGTVEYGTATGLAPDVVVQYRKAYVPRFGSECYIRREAGVDRVIADKAEMMDLDITAQSNNTFKIDAWFTPLWRGRQQTNQARVTSSDRVMLRNPRID